MLALVLNSVSYVQTQILYECNFDNATIVNHCFTSSLLVVGNVGFPGSIAPNGALSDVKSISNHEFI